MARTAPTVTLVESERTNLARLADHSSGENRLAQRARIVLLAAEGLMNKEIADCVDVTPKTVSKWRRRWVEDGFDGLDDRDRTGRPRKITLEDKLTILKTASQPPKETGHWTLRDLHRDLAGEVDLSLGRLHQLLDDLDFKPHRNEYCSNSTDLDFIEKQLTVVGLYLHPPVNALIISSDGTTQTPSIRRHHPDGSISPGTPPRPDFQDEHNGSQNLFAALVAHSGEVKDRQRSETFVEFLATIEKEFPGKELHIIVDNLSTHSTNRLDKHKRITIHFTPTHVSWLNQIELWFSILQCTVSHRHFFESRQERAKAMIQFIEQSIEDARPFEWRHSGGRGY